MSTESLPPSPQSVDIRSFRGDYYHIQQTLTAESAEVVGETVDFHLSAVNYNPTTNNPWGGGVDLVGRRSMVGVFASLKGRSELIQLVSGPSEFSRYGHDDSELHQERAILDLMRRQLEDLPAEASTGIVMPLPLAHQTKEAVYESTAPGISLRNALDVIAQGHASGEFSDKEVALILHRVYASSRLSLEQLHGLGIKHNHPHIDNFNVDITSGLAKLFDYTIAVSKHDQQTHIKVDSGILTANNLEEDIEQFETSWKQAIGDAGLGGLTPLAQFELPEMIAVVEKLESAVMSKALRKLGLSELSTEDVQRALSLRDKLVGSAPDVFYPKDTLHQRLKTKLALARRAIREVFDSF